MATYTKSLGTREEPARRAKIVFGVLAISVALTLVFANARQSGGEGLQVGLDDEGRATQPSVGYQADDGAAFSHGSEEPAVKQPRVVVLQSPRREAVVERLSKVRFPAAADGGRLVALQVEPAFGATALSFPGFTSVTANPLDEPDTPDEVFVQDELFGSVKMTFVTEAIRSTIVGQAQRDADAAAKGSPPPTPEKATTREGGRLGTDFLEVIVVYVPDPRLVPAGIRDGKTTELPREALGHAEVRSFRGDMYVTVRGGIAYDVEDLLPVLEETIRLSTT